MLTLMLIYLRVKTGIISNIYVLFRKWLVLQMILNQTGGFLTVNVYLPTIGLIFLIVDV